MSMKLPFQGRWKDDENYKYCFIFCHHKIKPFNKQKKFFKNRRNLRLNSKKSPVFYCYSVSVL